MTTTLEIAPEAALGTAVVTGLAAGGDSATGTVAGRLTIISAGIGGGHDGAAAALAAQFAGLGYASDRHDFLDLLPGRSGRLMCASYKRMLTAAPWLYQSVYQRTEKTGRPGAGQRRLLRASDDAVLATIGPDTVAVVATYPLAAQVLGRLRSAGRITVPVITYFTDFSVHPSWIAPGVDLNLAQHAASVEIAEGHLAAAEAAEHVRGHVWTRVVAQAEAGVGPGFETRAQTRTVVARPLVDPRFQPPTATGRAFARIRFGLPDQQRLALIIGGSWGVGDVEKTALEIAESGAAVPVVVCGHNQRLRDRLHAAGLKHVFGWVGDMPSLMQAVDVLVTSNGGLSGLEAMATGLPVATYRCIPGHGLANAEVMADAGVAPWIRVKAGLPVVLAELADGSLGASRRAAGLAVFDAPTAVEAIVRLIG